ncbi:hypothetical protein ACQKWADRAFT_303901 [Trichoderma austrokoningii]
MRPVPASGSASAHRGRPDSLTPNATIPAMTYMVGTEDSISDLGEMSFHAQRFPYKNEYESSQRAGRSGHRSNMSASTSISWPSPSLSSQLGGGETPHDLSRPMTPVNLGTTGPESVISSASSPLSSPVHSMSASRISSSLSLISPHQGDIGLYSHTMGDLAGSHTPQLIMPSLTVPRRRPFSTTGKSLGKLKVLVTGPGGIGKSTLITAIAQSSEHIVHVDPVSTHNKGEASEVYASTRPYPWWKAELDASTASRRRSSAMDEMLDRNLCFVDCPPQTSQGTHPAIRYVESQLFPLLNRPISDGDLWNLLSSGTEPIVDAVLYMLPHTGPEPSDVETIRLLQNTTNVIPLLARADEINNDQAMACKQYIDDGLREKDVEYFSFRAPGVPSEGSDIYAVSSIADSDDDVMDASVLMNSEYVRPLVSTDLSRLVEQLMSHDGSARLRHAASLKCVRWRRQTAITSSAQTALICRQPMSLYSYSPSLWGRSYSPEQYDRPLEMASWAESLRQSLEAERLGELPVPMFGPGMTMNNMPLARVNQKLRRQKSRKSRRDEVVPHHQDPLGLLGLAGQIKCNSRLTLELVSSIGVIGFVTSWLARPDGLASKC